MKNNLLLFLLLLLVVPTISTSAEICTMVVEFSFTSPDDPAKELLGYRLYKEGEQVCQTSNPNTSEITCEFLAEDGTFNFTLTAYYTDSTESPPSPSFPFTITSATNTESTAEIPSTPTTPSIESPTAVLSSSAAVGNAPLTVNFNGKSSTPNLSLVSYIWTFGDGTQSSGETTSHTFTTAGTYYTQLTITDNQGLSDSIKTPIIVVGTAPENESPITVITDIVNAKPIAVITASTPSQNDPLTFSFAGSRSSDSDGSITQYSWSFGDGTTGSGQSVLHTYNSAAAYTASLQVTDDSGETTTTSIEITCDMTHHAESSDILPGFDKTYYLAAKLAALQANNTNWIGKTAADLELALQNAGFTAESHYSQYGYLEGLEPNQYFNHTEFILAKAKALYEAGSFDSIEEAQSAFNEAWKCDAYLHYLAYGAAEGINPSNDFDESQYLSDKLVALLASDTEWAGGTVDELREVLASYGMTALDHYFSYGWHEGLRATPVPTDERVE